MQAIKANLSITRDSNDKMNIRVQDEASRATFLEIPIEPHDLMMALTGLAYIDVNAVVNELDIVGKQKITEKRSIECPLSGYSKKEELVKWLEGHGKEEGWEVHSYLGSQGSVVNRDGKTVLNYSVYRYE
jgi:hypothetical protein